MHATYLSNNAVKTIRNTCYYTFTNMHNHFFLERKNYTVSVTYEHKLANMPDLD